MEGRPPNEANRYDHWCTFWGTKPMHLGVPDVEPDLSPSKDLQDTVLVHEDEKNLRHDLDEDLRWFKNHNNKKPQKSEFREQARRSKSVLELLSIDKGQYDDQIQRNFNRFGHEHLTQAARPRRLEHFGSSNKVWTPRARPKTPAPINIRNRLGKAALVDMPSQYDRDPTNFDRKDLDHHAFGCLRSPNKSELMVKDEAKSAEYDRFSNYKDDLRTHWRKSNNPSAAYGEPVTTQMEIGWHAVDKESYVPICGPSPAIHDAQLGLPRISLAGGTPGRLASQMSKFVDNVLMTRPGFNPF